MMKIIVLLGTVAATFSTKPPSSTQNAPIARLVPIGSTTAFMCHPIFHHNGVNATWYKNNHEHPIGDVNGHQNLVLRQPSSDEKKDDEKEDPMPKIGFLVIHNVSKEDEGNYYCQSTRNGETGDTYHLKTAYVTKLPASSRITLHPQLPTLGRPLIAHCPLPDAYPPPKITWTVNSLPISHVSSDFRIFDNGTLEIAHFSYHHFGFVECHVTNFAGKTSSNIFIDSRQILEDLDSSKSVLSIGCSAAFRSSIFMFLMGCLATSTIVLIYLGCAFCWLKPGRPRRILRPTFWSRTDPRLAPGFRKAVVPLPDCFATLPTSRMLVEP